MLLLGAVVASLAIAGTAGVAGAATPTATASPTPVAICPAIGTVAVANVSGGTSCVNNDCVSIATAATGNAAACESGAARSQTVMDVAPTPAPIVAAPRNPGLAAAPLAPAASLSTSALIIRGLIGIGIIALLLAGALALGGRRTRRQTAKSRA
jgi:hypothetical protein